MAGIGASGLNRREERDVVLVVDHPVTVVTAQDQVVFRLEVEGAVELLATPRGTFCCGGAESVCDLGRCDRVPEGAALVEHLPVAEGAAAGGLRPEGKSDAWLEAAGANLGVPHGGGAWREVDRFKGRPGRLSAMSCSW